MRTARAHSQELSLLMKAGAPRGRCRLWDRAGGRGAWNWNIWNMELTSLTRSSLAAQEDSPGLRSTGVCHPAPPCLPKVQSTCQRRGRFGDAVRLTVSLLARWHRCR